LHVGSCCEDRVADLLGGRQAPSVCPGLRTLLVRWTGNATELDAWSFASSPLTTLQRSTSLQPSYDFACSPATWRPG
jgi:hypothetical protein